MRRRLNRYKLHVITFFAVIGPGFITANVDNEAGGIYTYSLAGARYGYLLLWTVIPMAIALLVVQEMCARMGAVTGKGLSDLIREEFGFRTTFLMMSALVIANFGNVVAEFAGVASSLALFGISHYISVPISAAVVWFLVVFGTYKTVEKVFLAASSFYVAYIASGILAQPDWVQAGLHTVQPTFRMEPDFVLLVVGMIGATIAPWMQFYLQAAVVERGVEARHYPESRLEVIVGCIFAMVVVFFIVVACAATLNANGITDIRDAAHAAAALAPLAGRYAGMLFALGLFNASLFAASILPLSTAYSVCEGLGVEAGVNKKFREAPFFYWLYTLLIVLGAAVVLLPNFPMIRVMLLSQVVNGILLPFVLVFMLLLINRKDIMGEYVNSKSFNVVAWVTAAVVASLTLILAADVLR